MTVPVPIDEARHLGKRYGWKRIAIIYTDGSDVFGITTYGATRAECRALARWAQSESGTNTAIEIAEADIWRTREVKG